MGPYRAHAALLKPSHRLPLITSHTMTALQSVSSHYCWATRRFLIFHAAPRAHASVFHRASAFWEKLYVERRPARAAPRELSRPVHGPAQQTPFTCPHANWSSNYQTIRKAMKGSFLGGIFWSVQVAHKSAATTIKTKLNIVFLLPKCRVSKSKCIYWYMKFIFGMRPRLSSITFHCDFLI